VAKPKRFRLRSAEGVEDVPKAETPGAVLSKAITRAARSIEPGTWEVLEYDDVIYKVTRTDNVKLDVRVEVMR